MGKDLKADLFGFDRSTTVERGETWPVHVSVSPNRSESQEMPETVSLLAHLRDTYSRSEQERPAFSRMQGKAVMRLTPEAFHTWSQHLQLSAEKGAQTPFPYTCAMPPSAKSSVPVTKLLSSDARKSTALATSSGAPMRPIGVSSSICTLNCSASSFVCPTEVPSSVSMMPGLMALTRILAIFQVERPSARERSHGRLGSAVDAESFPHCSRSGNPQR